MELDAVEPGSFMPLLNQIVAYVSIAQPETNIVEVSKRSISQSCLRLWLFFGRVLEVQVIGHCIVRQKFFDLRRRSEVVARVVLMHAFYAAV